MPHSHMKHIVCFSTILALSACGTITGIPSHGGGKRFATEQRLVSASIRSALKDIDVSQLRGKRVAMVFDIIADEGGGSLNGGRMNFLGAATSGFLAAPITASSSAFQLFNLSDSGSNYSNGSNVGSATANTAFLNNSTNQRRDTSNNSSSGNSTGTQTESSTGYTTGQSTNANSSTQNSTGTNDSTRTTTGNDAFGDINQVEKTTGTGTQNMVSTSKDSGSNTQNSTGTSTSSNTSNNTQTSTGSNTGSDSGSQTGDSKQANQSNDKSQQAGGYTSNRQEMSQTPSYNVVETRGNQKSLTATLEYKGLGEYQNFAVPKSDASLLMGLTRNYLLLNGVYPVAPTDEDADALLYVTVDIFGIVRSRFDAYIFNQETLKAETSFEMMAFDRNGQVLMQPKSTNREAQYAERYLLWAGPFRTDERVNKGKGLLVDFSDVDGQHQTYGQEEIHATYPFGKN